MGRITLSKMGNVVENQISHFQRGSHRLLHCTTKRGQRRRVALKFVQLDLHAVFGDNANIVERWLKHSNETADMNRLPWHAIGDHRPSY